MLTKLHSLSIREMLEGEQKICAYILTIAWNKAFPNKLRNITAQEFKEKTRNELVLVAENNNEVVGFISLDESESYIHQLFVNPRYQRREIGKALINYIIQRRKGCLLNLKCNIENVAAIAFFQAFGFIRTEESGEDETGPWIKLQQTKS